MPTICAHSWLRLELFSNLHVALARIVADVIPGDCFGSAAAQELTYSVWQQVFHHGQ